MLIAIICKDKKDSLDLRIATREKHIEYLNSLGNTLRLSGPLYEGDDVMNMNGSLVIVEVDNMEAAKEISANDPYAQAGLFETVDFKPWNLLFNHTTN